MRSITFTDTDGETVLWWWKITDNVAVEDIVNAVETAIMRLVISQAGVRE